ncbi:MAG: hypothetical protein V2A79_11080 [Planctomycetota bacterium]
MSGNHRFVVLRLLAVTGLATVFVWPASPAAASTVVPMNLESLADHAGQVIVGQVAAVRSYWVDGPRRIESEIAFEQVEYLKGGLRDAAPTFTLTVPGGTVGEVHIEVCCAPSFATGDKWVLFLLPTYKTFPVAGLYQGAFLVRPDAQGIERVYHVRHGNPEPIAGFDAQGFGQVAGPQGGSAHEHLVGATNARMRPLSESNAPRAVMSYAAFLARIRPVLASSKDHLLTEPAGRPEGGLYRSTPLAQTAADRSTTAGDANTQTPVVRGAAERNTSGEPRP